MEVTFDLRWLLVLFHALLTLAAFFGGCTVTGEEDAPKALLFFWPLAGLFGLTAWMVAWMVAP